MSRFVILLWGLLLVSTPALPAESHGTGGNWQHGIAVGVRTGYAPASLPAKVLEYNLSKPFATRRYLYHRVNIGLWHRQENRTPPDVIVIPTGTLPSYSTAYAAYSVGIRSPGPVYFYLSHGAGLISETTPYLGSHGQFQTALGVGYHGSKRTVECGVQHLSNGSRFFSSPQPNLGEDFFLCSVTIRR